MRVIYWGWKSHYDRITDGFDSIDKDGVLPPSAVDKNIGISPKDAKEIWERDNRKRFLQMKPRNFRSPTAVVTWGYYMPKELPFLPVNAYIRETLHKDQYANLHEKYETNMKLTARVVSREDIENMEFDGKIKIIARTDLTAKGGGGAVLVDNRDIALELLKSGALLLEYHRKRRQFRTQFWIGADGRARHMTGAIVRIDDVPKDEQRVIVPTRDGWATSYNQDTVSRCLEAIYDKGNIIIKTKEGSDIEFDEEPIEDIVDTMMMPYQRCGIIGRLRYGAIDWAVNTNNEVVVFEANSSPGVRIERTKAFFANMIRYWQSKDYHVLAYLNEQDVQ